MGYITVNTVKAKGSRWNKTFIQEQNLYLIKVLEHLKSPTMYRQDTSGHIQNNYTSVA